MRLKDEDVLGGLVVAVVSMKVRGRSRQYFSHRRDGGGEQVVKGAGSQSAEMANRGRGRQAWHKLSAMPGFWSPILIKSRHGYRDRDIVLSRRALPGFLGLLDKISQ